MGAAAYRSYPRPLPEEVEAQSKRATAVGRLGHRDPTIRAAVRSYRQPRMRQARPRSNCPHAAKQQASMFPTAPPPAA